VPYSGKKGRRALSDLTYRRKKGGSRTPDLAG